LLTGCLGGLVQSLWQAKPRPRLIQLLFNFANLAISISLANLVFHSHFAYNVGLRWPLLLAAASTTYFAMNTMSVSGIIAMTERRNPVLVARQHVRVLVDRALASLLRSEWRCDRRNQERDRQAERLSVTYHESVTILWLVYRVDERRRNEFAYALDNCLLVKPV